MLRLMTGQLVDEILQQSKKSKRLRLNYNFHQNMSENPHRFLNVLNPGSYIQPHRHLKPAKCETFVLLQGSIKFFIFDDKGNIEQCHLLNAKSGIIDNFGIDIDAGVWHSLCCITEPAVCFEVKPGPYLQSNDKDFAPWAPEEDTKEAKDYLTFLEEYQGG